MTRRTLSTILLTGLLTLPKAIFAEGEPRIIAGPYLQHTTQTSMTIMWETDAPCVSGIKYGKARFRPHGQKGKPDLEKILDLNVSSKETRTIHEFTLEGLEPETDYFYQAHSLGSDGEKIQSDVLIFQTAVRATSPFAFVVMGDNRTYPKRFKQLADKAWAERPNFVLNVGDVVTNGKNKASSAESVGTLQRDVTADGRELRG